MNKFGIRHQNAQQQADYDAVFLDWVFWFYLATIELTDRLLSREAHHRGRVPTVVAGSRRVPRTN